MSAQNWEHFFKPEVRSSGRTILVQDKISITQPSDTEIVAYIRVSPPLKVSLKTKSISSDTVFVDCNCPASKKDLLCKHIWAALLATEQENPDFFENKIELEKLKFASQATANPKLTAQSKAYEDKQTAYKEQQKEKQSLYRKVQYQKQKLRMTDYKNKKNNPPEQPAFPRDVENALNFFSQNGFELRESMNKEITATAKKKLSRIFHPDHGGTHEEILELNRCSDILMKFINKLSSSTRPK
ncbi:MAG: hypothetical protein A2622_04015 [Bdellovibrionales bacterium RIFCSPHIGHO2_01_FULL_40_29]|nr:MAG: hypothetical protein A2622_04015 [Bdellovibrionales bacterium RIFCSPHIGHO2_01_FULL_40_29]OFZ35323.1 MAG: hypothetical protein A3D17_08015 [Bdellovibrionales bacterium RIFCSPHIGHO2_02_FULL_40_15]